MARARRHALAALVLFGLLTLGAPAARSQLVLDHFPGQSTFVYANGVTISMYVQITSPVPFQAFDVDVTFDPTLLKAMRTTMR